MRSNPILWWIEPWEDETKPAARQDRDTIWGGGIPETITYFRLDTCEQDCNFVYRVWDFCSDNYPSSSSTGSALADESEAVVRLYNAAGLHSEYHVGAQGHVHFGEGYSHDDWVAYDANLGPIPTRRWDVFQLDASGGDITVEDCSSGNCPDDLTEDRLNHEWC